MSLGNGNSLNGRCLGRGQVTSVGCALEWGTDIPFFLSTSLHSQVKSCSEQRSCCVWCATSGQTLSNGFNQSWINTPKTVNPSAAFLRDLLRWWKTGKLTNSLKSLHTLELGCCQLSGGASDSSVVTGLSHVVTNAKLTQTIRPTCPLLWTAGWSPALRGCTLNTHPSTGSLRQHPQLQDHGPSLSSEPLLVSPNFLQMLRLESNWWPQEKVPFLRDSSQKHLNPCCLPYSPLSLSDPEGLQPCGEHICF